MCIGMQIRKRYTATKHLMTGRELPSRQPRRHNFAGTAGFQLGSRTHNVHHVVGRRILDCRNLAELQERGVQAAR